MSERMRAAAIIERDGRILMMRQRVQTQPGHHDGPEYWYLPGGGSEDPYTAMLREVDEEVGLCVTSATEVTRVPYPAGFTTVFRVEVADGEPRLGVDELPCPCPRMTGLDWVDPPSITPHHGGSPVPLLIYAW